ncbi:signal peptidase I [Anopheles sinensis]|uniref:Signal peptidase I n=1 Tax=Anopheles sinensis TaxID=74873 RepID=A0A084VKR1_ANOSI|nr:signal peptidase I [Anopheles sinensis]
MYSSLHLVRFGENENSKIVGARFYDGAALHFGTPNFETEAKPQTEERIDEVLGFPVSKSTPVSSAKD